ncbi:hypothetical protein Pint_32980 [Pistacia integerrima]|uniref:Uncharacterized protein n=1 Tax=Pistacia integerrima TaxID=434235 RepID=A0ACC0X307_9ROSI|nr:hypothetical protein Pint_32980 [Pistacia integerrima]
MTPSCLISSLHHRSPPLRHQLHLIFARYHRLFLSMLSSLFNFYISSLIDFLLQ